jgi:maltose alpha-D-glucosyltransferase/alpha-amylase
MTLAVVQGFVQHQGDAGQYSREELKRFFERVVTKRDWGRLPPVRSLCDLLAEDSPGPAIKNMIGAYLDAARLLGRRTAELHLALLAGPENPDFAIEPYSMHYQRSMYQSMRNVTGKVSRLLKTHGPRLTEDLRASAQRLFDNHDRIVRVFDRFLKRRVNAVRVRCHGDLHLGQFLYTGKDFMIIDFEGDASKPLSDRRRKRSALRDVAAMTRSFHYAAMMSLLDQLKTGALGERDYATVEPFANLWHTWSSWAYVKGYQEAAGRAPFVSRDPDEFRALMDAFRLEKALTELEYELYYRPEYIRIPLHGIEQILSLTQP